jgi:hypothetical protein
MNPSTLLAACLAITTDWRSLFPQKRTWQRGVRQSLGSLVCLGRRCYKEVPGILWQGGAQRRLLRLFVIAPTPYQKRASSKLYYRQPAYLLTSIPQGHAHALRQIYFDRWQIEVNHREEKDTLGVGQAQLWNATSVPKQPAFAVAAYSALLLASLQTFGAQRGPAFAPLPQWRRHAPRPSCLDLVTLLRKEMVQYPHLLAPFDLNLTHQALNQAAAASNM